MRKNRCSILMKLLIIGLVGLVMLVLGYLLLNELVTMTNVHYQGLYDDLLKPSVKVSTTRGSGSGVVISHRATEDTENIIYILTAAHVVSDESIVQVYIYHQDPKTLNSISLCLSAFVAATDTNKDLALLRITNNEPLTTICTARLAPREYVPYIFTPVWAVGASLGIPPRPTKGQVTHIGQDYWEINAPIISGNSGGPIYNAKTHEVIGIAVQVYVRGNQLVTTMGKIVPLQDIYEFLESYKGLHIVTDGYKKLIRGAQPYATSSNLNSQPVVT